MHRQGSFGVLPGTLTVPGSVASWTEAHAAYGRLPLRRCLDSAIGYARDGTYTLRLVRESGGCSIAVSDDEIRRAMGVLAAGNGIFAEPTGASSLAAAQKMLARGDIGPDERIVCMVTGHGFKDFGIYRQMPVHEIRVEADAPASAVTRALAEMGPPERVV